MAWIDFIVFAGGLALGVWQHDNILKYWQGAETFAKNLEAKATAIKSAVSTVAKS